MSIFAGRKHTRPQVKTALEARLFDPEAVPEQPRLDLTRGI